MATFPFNANTRLGGVLRGGIDETRSGRYKLAWIMGVIQGMTNQQIADEFGFADAVTAGTAKAELLSGIGNLLANNIDISSATTYAAVVQMLNQFG